MNDIHPQWRLTDRQVEEAEKKDFVYHRTAVGRFILKRDRDEARIWPHIDGFCSCFIRKGMYVQHKKYLELTRALDREFGE
jgi:hypothetical protein